MVNESEENGKGKKEVMNFKLGTLNVSGKENEIVDICEVQIWKFQNVRN